MNRPDPHTNPHPQVRDLAPARELIEHPESWTPELFRKMHFMGGLEIHQQVATRRKLFCRCPAVPMPHEPAAARVYRHMRPTLSEMGTYDGTALMEFKTKKNVIYELIDPVSCTYEMDDTPPFLIDEEAMRKSLAIALMMNCKIIDELHVARKQYLDGSIPTGFQRTAIIGLDGWIPYKGRRIRIRQISLEEDSCREVNDVGHEITFRTDRLGFPLLEVVTEPDARDPWELAGICRLLGDIMRSSGMVRRGMGASRQDVNVSIGGSTRIENKGVSRYGYIPRLTCVEALRHKALLELRDELRCRGLNSVDAERHVLDGEELGFAKRSVGLAVLRGWRGLLDWRTQPDFRFVDELRGVVRVVACLDRFPYVYSEHDRADWALPTERWSELRRRMNVGDNDELALVVGPEGDVATALDEIIDRCTQALTEAVPKQTRQALADERLTRPDGRRLSGVQTDFERVLPGADRMYPDTDHPPRAVSRDELGRIDDALPEPLWERRAAYRAAGLPADVVRTLSRERRPAELFEELVTECPGVDPVLIGVTLVQTARHLRREGLLADIGPELARPVFSAVESGKLVPDAVPRLLAEYGARLRGEPCQDHGVLIEELLKDYQRLPCDELRGVVSEVRDAAEGEGPPDTGKRGRYLMGRVRERIGWRAPGRKLEELLAAGLAKA